MNFVFVLKITYFNNYALYAEISEVKCFFLSDVRFCTVRVVLYSNEATRNSNDESC